MALTLRDSLYQSTTNSIWVCMIEGRIMTGSGWNTRSRNKCGWTNKNAVAQAFKHTPYWKFIKSSLKAQHPEINSSDWWYSGRGEAKKIMKDEYNRLLNEGIVKYIEITQVPDWVNI